jgi:hypothetical protein
MGGYGKEWVVKLRDGWLRRGMGVYVEGWVVK